MLVMPKNLHVFLLLMRQYIALVFTKCFRKSFDEGDYVTILLFLLALSWTGLTKLCMDLAVMACISRWFCFGFVFTSFLCSLV
jgi:hypothetical protein